MVPDRTWKKYYENVGLEPNSLAVRAASRVTQKRAALDLGCGNGRDSLYLHLQGFEVVVAVDPSPDAPAWFVPGILRRMQDAENFMFKQHESVLTDRYDLILCLNTLFFIEKETVLRLIDAMHTATAPLQFMAFNVLGERDGWVGSKREVSYFADGEIDGLRRRHSIANYELREFDGTVADGSPKHWHTHSFVYRKY